MVVMVRRRFGLFANYQILRGRSEEVPPLIGGFQKSGPARCALHNTLPNQPDSSDPKSSCIGAGHSLAFLGLPLEGNCTTCKKGPSVSTIFAWRRSLLGGSKHCALTGFGLSCPLQMRRLDREMITFTYRGGRFSAVMTRVSARLGLAPPIYANYPARNRATGRHRYLPI